MRPLSLNLIQPVSPESSNHQRVHPADWVSISIASPDTIRSWSKGKVTSYRTIKYQPTKREKITYVWDTWDGPKKSEQEYCLVEFFENGFYSARIFGPVDD